MVKSELDLLENFIEKFEDAIDVDEIDAELLYDFVNRANAMYSDETPEITAQYEEIVQYSGSLQRNSKAIIALLQRLLVREKNKFVAGIMPVTYENLSICPAAQEVYKTGIIMFSEGQYVRNVLDNVRLALELLVKQFLNNDRSLENQLSDLGIRLGEYHPEVSNLIYKTLDYLCKYQNHYVKHDDRIAAEEINFIIEQTSAVINFLTGLM